MAQPLDLAAVRSFDNLEFLARQLVEGFITGLHQSPYHGFSVEFSEHRLYNPGESTRHLDWKVFARTDKLFVKRYEEETNLRCHLLLDVSPSMYYPAPGHDKLRFSACSARPPSPRCSKAARRGGPRHVCQCSGAANAGALHQHPPPHAAAYAATTAGAPRSGRGPAGTNVAGVIHTIAQQIPKRSLVVLFSDMLGRAPEEQAETLAALQHLRHQHHEVLLFHVMDRATEANFDFADRPYLFEDVETGQTLKLQPNQVREQYQAAMRRYEQDLALRCGQYKIDFVPVDIREPFDKVLYAYLIKRGKVRG